MHRLGYRCLLKGMKLPVPLTDIEMNLIFMLHGNVHANFTA
jgi:hypothetical protein